MISKKELKNSSHHSINTQPAYFSAETMVDKPSEQTKENDSNCNLAARLASLQHLQDTGAGKLGYTMDCYLTHYDRLEHLRTGWLGGTNNEAHPGSKMKHDRNQKNEAASQYVVFHVGPGFKITQQSISDGIFLLRNPWVGSMIRLLTVMLDESTQNTPL